MNCHLTVPKAAKSLIWLHPIFTDAKLRQGSTFTQVDLLSGHLKYRLTNMNTKKSLDDIFTFKVGVTSEGGKSNIEVSSINTLFLGLNIQYILEDRNPKCV